MRKIVVSEFLSLDGVMEDPGGAEGFEHGGWSMAYGSEEIGMFKFSELVASDALLLGRVTYEDFAAAWPTMEGTGEFGERMNNNAKYVVSTTLKTADWNNSHIIQANVVDEIKKLKNQPGKDILVGGSAKLIQTLMDNDLVDTYRLLVYPVVLGSGKRLFRDGTTASLKLIESKDVGAGVVSFIYEPERKA
jgi:dihydrofolate reductase